MSEYGSVSEALQAIAQDVDAASLAGLNTVALFDLAGEGGGQWTMTIDDGDISVAEGKTEPPKLTFKMEASDFLDMTSGSLNPVMAYMQGRIKVQGDMGVAMRLQALFS
jgi:putative sterol carrier protein